MLAVFEKTVAKCPEGLKAEAKTETVSAGSLVNEFCSARTGAVAVNLGAAGAIAFSSEKQNPLLPRLFAVVDDIFCVFEGNIENISPLKQQYGLNKTANEVVIIIEAYKTLRDRGPYPADQVVRDLHGKFAFILYDSSSRVVFVAADMEEGVPFFWGADPEGRVVFSDDLETIKTGCGKSCAPFPKGCFFTTFKGLQSYEHPLKEMKAVPRVDSQGQVCGSTFKVDESSRKEPAGMHKVDSAANWSGNY
ncbi:stem-specific protein TSJT1-like [Wolffia australiana]